VPRTIVSTLYRLRALSGYGRQTSGLSDSPAHRLDHETGQVTSQRGGHARYIFGAFCKLTEDVTGRRNVPFSVCRER